MQLVIDVLATLLQIGLFAFLLWGASLSLPDLLSRPRVPRQPREMKQVALAEQAGIPSACRFTS